MSVFVKSVLFELRFNCCVNNSSVIQPYPRERSDSIAQLVVLLTADPGVASQLPAWLHNFCGD